MTAKTVLLAAAFAALVSCSNNKTEDTKVLSTQTTQAVDASAFMSSFVEAWNKKDSAAVVNMLADDAVMLSGRAKMIGKKEIADRFVHRNMPVTGSVKTDNLQTNASGALAYVTGNWTLTTAVPGQPAGTESGNETFVWKKGTDNAWKIVLINMEDHDPVEEK